MCLHEHSKLRLRNTRASIVYSWLILIVILAGVRPTTATAQTPVVPSDKLGWVQSAVATDLPNLTYALFVDGVRQPLTGHICTAGTSGTYDCTAPLPAFTTGTHTLELVAILTVTGQAYESAKSAPFQVRLVIIASPTGLKIVRPLP